MSKTLSDGPWPLESFTSRIRRAGSSLTRMFAIVAGLVLAAHLAPGQTIIASLPLAGYYAGQIAVNPLTSRVYIAGSYAQPNIVIVDASVGTNPIIVGPSSPITGVIGIGVAPLLNSFYTSQGYAGSIGTYSTVNNQLLGTTPTAGCGGYMAADSSVPGLTLVYLGSSCGSGNDTVHVMNGVSRGIVAGPLSSGGTITGLLVSPFLNRVYIAKAFGTRVLLGFPSFSFVNDYSGAAYSVAPISHKLYAWWQSNLTVWNEVPPVPYMPWNVIQGAGGRTAVHEPVDHVYSWDGSNIVRVLSVSSDSMLGSITFPPTATVHWVTADPANNRIYLTASVPSGLTTLYVIRDDGCVSSGGQANSAAAGLSINSVGGIGCGGPFSIGVPSGGTLMLDWTGPADAPFALAFGPVTSASLAMGCTGTLNIGTAPTFGDVIILFDGTQPGPSGSLFRLGAQGSASQSFTIALPPGIALGGLQGAVFQPAGIPCPVVLTAAFAVSAF